MSLHAIVRALGGDLYQGGHRASIPAPGHSAADRSVSLLLSHGRVIIHGFGAAAPIAANDATAGRERNRRVEVWLTAKDVVQPATTKCTAAATAAVAASR